MSNLLNNIRVLGIRNGYRYWRIQKIAKTNPEIALRWAEGCDNEVYRLRQQIHALEEWSDKLRTQYWKFKTNQPL